MLEHGDLLFATMKAAVGEYAGGYGFPLPNPVSLRPEHLRLRLEMEWRMNLKK